MTLGKENQRVGNLHPPGTLAVLPLSIKVYTDGMNNAPAAALLYD